MKSHETINKGIIEYLNKEVKGISRYVGREFDFKNEFESLDELDEYRDKCLDRMLQCKDIEDIFKRLKKFATHHIRMEKENHKRLLEEFLNAGDKRKSLKKELSIS